MTFPEISERLTILNEALIEKGYVRPDCGVSICPSDFTIYIRTATQGNIEGVFTWVESTDFSSAFDEAEDKVEALSTVEEHKKRTSVRHFGQAIDALREAGFEADFVDPLAESLQAMSDNLLTYYGDKK